MKNGIRLVYDIHHFFMFYLHSWADNLWDLHELFHTRYQFYNHIKAIHI